jgi:hypothetical protein
MCFGDEGEAPRAAVVALGTRAYLGLLENEELVPGHCRIVPIQHHFTSLDADDETWDEIKVSIHLFGLSPYVRAEKSGSALIFF